MILLNSYNFFKIFQKTKNRLWLKDGFSKVFTIKNLYSQHYAVKFYRFLTNIYLLLHEKWLNLAFIRQKLV